MKKRSLHFNRLVSLLLFVFFAIVANAQHPIISEIFLSEESYRTSYLELYNPGDEPLDLGQYLFANTNERVPSWEAATDSGYHARPYMIYLSGTLAPEECWILHGYTLSEEGDTLAVPALWEIKDTSFYNCPDGPAKCGIGTSFFRNFGGTSAIGLFWIADKDSVITRLDQSDSIVWSARDKILVDAFGVPGSIDMLDVGGKTAVSHSAPFVRKANITVGEPDFNKSRGTTADETDWLLLPNWPDLNIDGSTFNYGVHEIRYVHNTIGINGNSTDIDFSSDVVSINESSKTISLPYGIERRDLLSYINLGDNAGYSYIIGADTANSILFRTGDSINFFVAGNELTEEKYGVEVAQPTDNYVRAYRSFTGPQYEISWENPGMDTISNIGYGHSVDTLWKYIELPANATAEIIFEDGVDNRAFLKNGDKLKITAQNTDTKEYYLKSNDYNLAAANGLRMIFIPGIGLQGDSIPNFDSGILSYNILLEKGTKTIPGIIPVCNDTKSKALVTPPKALEGEKADRTAIIAVYAENDTLTREYSVVFEIEKNYPEFYNGTPFFSQLVNSNFTGAVEIFNPNDEMLDMSKYVIINNITLKKAGTVNEKDDKIGGRAYDDLFTENNWKADVRFRLRPGYYLDTEREGVYWKPTSTVSSRVAPRSTFLIVEDDKGGDGDGWDTIQFFNPVPLANFRAVTAPSTDRYMMPDYEFDDFRTTGSFTERAYHLFTRLTHSYLLLEIINDEVIQGTKSAEMTDFRVVDIIGECGNNTNPDFGHGTLVSPNTFRLYRKPNIFQGNRNSSFSEEGSFANAINPEKCEWNYLTDNANNIVLGYDAFTAVGDPTGLGEHEYNLTVNLSMIISSTYLATDGYVEDQTITGVAENTSIEGFYANIIKMDAGQNLSLWGASGEVTDGIIAAGDTLRVFSADSSIFTNYIVNELGALSNAADLTSTTYTVDGIEVQGIVPGTDLIDVLNNVEVSQGATYVVVDTAGQIIPVLSPNTILELVYTKALDIYSIVVTAEDRTTTKSYKLTFTSSNDDLWVLSNFYNIDNDEGVISELSNESVAAFIDRLIIPEGATIKIVDKYGTEKTDGRISYDDQLIITSESQNTKTFDLDFGALEIEDGSPGNGDGSSVKEIKEQVLNYNVFPNPTNGECFVKGTEEVEMYIVRNIYGSVITQKTTERNETISIDLSSQIRGIYLITLIDVNRNMTTARVIKY